ncbi:hypothetical protein L7F22_020981 [Adiantum nelumboides]|nr:hypothetical protein [Adiantum nelumboides]
MKEGSSVSSYLNEFNALYSQLTSKGLNFDDEMKAIFLLCSLPASWDTFNTAFSNSTHGGKLAFDDFTSALLTEEIQRQSLDNGGHGDDKKKEEGKIVLETKMHCAACRYKVYKAIICQPGVEDVSIGLKRNRVTLKAPNIDAKKLFKSVNKKSGGKITKLLYPDPKEEKTEKKEEKKPIEVIVVLKVNMDCASCMHKVEKAAWKVTDVCSVKAVDQTLTLRGWDLDPKKVCKEIMQKSGKHAEVVPPKKDGEKKTENAKKEEKEGAQSVYVYAPQYFSEENPNACVLM